MLAPQIFSRRCFAELSYVPEGALEVSDYVWSLKPFHALSALIDWSRLRRRGTE